jgi:hypothetical protein
LFYTNILVYLQFIRATYNVYLNYFGPRYRGIYIWFDCEVVVTSSKIKI